MLTNLPIPYDFCVGNPISCLLTVGSMPVQHSVLNVKSKPSFEAVVRTQDHHTNSNTALLQGTIGILYNQAACVLVDSVLFQLTVFFSVFGIAIHLYNRWPQANIF